MNGSWIIANLINRAVGCGDKPLLTWGNSHATRPSPRRSALALVGCGLAICGLAACGSDSAGSSRSAQSNGFAGTMRGVSDVEGTGDYPLDGGALATITDGGEFRLPVSPGEFAICYWPGDAGGSIWGCDDVRLPDEAELEASWGEAGFHIIVAD